MKLTVRNDCDLISLEVVFADSSNERFLWKFFSNDCSRSESL